MGAAVMIASVSRRFESRTYLTQVGQEVNRWWRADATQLTFGTSRISGGAAKWEVEREKGFEPTALRLGSTLRAAC